jgi:hypothetical protein
MRVRPDGKTVTMHDEIMGTKGVGHRDGDGLNNRTYNLRPAIYLRTTAIVVLTSTTSRGSKACVGSRAARSGS